MPRTPGTLMHHNLETVELALRTVALYGGNCTRAHAQLTDSGVDLTLPMLREWVARRYVDRYFEVQKEVTAEISERIATRAEHLAFQALDVQELAIAKSREQLHAGQAKDPSGVARNLATVMGIMTDKSNLLRGRPTSIVETRSAEEILKALASKLPANVTIDSTAEEIA